jgi:hypothetical protein
LAHKFAWNVDALKMRVLRVTQRKKRYLKLGLTLLAAWLLVLGVLVLGARIQEAFLSRCGEQALNGDSYSVDIQVWHGGALCFIVPPHNDTKRHNEIIFMPLIRH